MTSAGFNAPGAGHTSRVITTPDGDLVEDAIAVSAESHDAIATLGSGTWLLQVAAFKPAGGAPAAVANRSAGRTDVRHCHLCAESSEWSSRQTVMERRAGVTPLP